MKTVAAVIVVAMLSAGCGSLSGSGSRGEKLADQDNDGIADALDMCEGTAVGQFVDATGCAVFAGPIENLQFKPGDHRLDASARLALDKLVADLMRHPDVSISLGGHTDNRGSAAANLQLSKRRVMSVVRYLVSNGVEPTRLKPYGYGENRPIVSNATLEGRIKNRRIEVGVISPKVIAQ